MPNIITILFIAITVTGCSTVQSWIPSFWDDNQSAYIVQVQLTVENLDCAQAQAPQVRLLEQDLRRFELYSQAKGSLQKDVLRVIEPMSSTVKEWRDRGEGSKAYCEIKKKLLAQQGQRAAKVILGRY
jgi:hypothetical protein